MCYVSCVTCHMSSVKYIFFSWQRHGVRRWMVCYQRGLPCFNFRVSTILELWFFLGGGDSVFFCVATNGGGFVAVAVGFDVGFNAGVGDRWHGTGDKWQVTCDRWKGTVDRWQVECDRWQVEWDRWHVTGGMWQVICDRWQVTGDRCGRWRMTCDIEGGGGGGVGGGGVEGSALLFAHVQRFSVSRIRDFFLLPSESL